MKKNHRPNRHLASVAIFLTVALVMLGTAAVFIHLARHQGQDPDQTQPPVIQTQPSTQATQPSTQPTQPTQPPVTLTGQATIGATGDLLMHLPCIQGGAQADGTYDFTGYFAHLQPYLEELDYAAANLETTLAGLDVGYSYSGYPNFNCPDQIVTSLQDVGFDMLLTANNHSYDTHEYGFLRTQQVIQSAGMDHIGTKPNLEADNYLIRQIDGIQVGMICYTYETNADPDKVALNGGANMTAATQGLINVFMKDDVAGFSASLEENIADMRADGAEAIVLFIHWGEEYQLTQNYQQEPIAQAACDLGVDVIVGGHPHVIQPIDLLESATDPDHKTVCLYSTGNLVSNQRQGYLDQIGTAHTEDGILFSFSFAKYSDGTVRLEAVEALPLWVDLYTDSQTGQRVYDVLPLDTAVEDWTEALDLRPGSLEKARASYERTMAIIGEGLAEVENYLATLPPIG